MNIRKTKIICTIGPATDDPKVLEEMIKSGMDVARLNFSHGTYEDHKKRMDEVKAVREKLGRFIPIMLDTKGPEIRIGRFAGGRVKIKAGQKFTLTTDEIEGTDEAVSISYKDLPKEIKKGNVILIDDGLLKLEVIDIKGNEIICIADNDAEISNSKGVNLPDSTINMPYVSEKDRSDLLFGIEQEVDFIAASFVRSAYDVFEIRKILEDNGGKHIKIIAKIENRDGVKNMDDILKAADGIMVARGDMGVEIPMEELPSIQKMLIRKCFLMGKIAITATQMLESMIEKPRPTRAEISDVANAVYDGSSAVMLSGESAAGKYPVQAVRTMSEIAEETEKHIDYTKRFRDSEFKIKNLVDAISHATCGMAIDIGAKAIVVSSMSGMTVRMVSRFRAPTDIIGMATTKAVWYKLALSWGVMPVMSRHFDSTDVLFYHAMQTAQKQMGLKPGDRIVLTGGMTNGKSGNTNLIKVETIGELD